MDLFEQFGITPEMQQFVTLFSLAFTVLYPLVRWGVIPTVRWVFKGTPHSELFLALKKQIADGPRSWASPPGQNIIDFGNLQADLGCSPHHDFWLKVRFPGKPDQHIGLLLPEWERTKLISLMYAAKDQMIKDDKNRLAAEVVAQIESRNGPFQFCANGMPYVPDKPAVQVVLTSACSPGVESNLTRQEGVEAPQSAEGDDATLEEYRKLAKDQLQVIQEQRIKIGQYILQIEGKEKEIKEMKSEWEFTARDRDRIFNDWKELYEINQKMKKDVEVKDQKIREKDEEFQLFLKKKEDSHQHVIKQQRVEIERLKSLCDLQSIAIVDADKTIKNQQELIDYLKQKHGPSPKALNPIQSEVIVDPYKRLKGVMAEALKENPIIPTLNIPKQT